MAAHEASLQHAVSALRRLPRLVYVALLATGAILTHGAVAQADGGKLQVSQRAGPWIVSLFTSPTPVVVGPVDVSALVQDAESRATLSDVSIRIVAREVSSGFTIERIATREAATNKLFQAAWLDLPTSGHWAITAEVSRGETVVETNFDVRASEAPPPWSSLALWIGWPCVAIGLYAAGQLRGRRKPMLQ